MADGVVAAVIHLNWTDTHLLQPERDIRRWRGSGVGVGCLRGLDPPPPAWGREQVAFSTSHRSRVRGASLKVENRRLTGNSSLPRDARRTLAD